MMKTLTKTIASYIPLLVLALLLSGIVPCQSQQQNEKFTKIYKTDLHASGSATCSEETRYFLANNTEVLLFLQYWLPKQEEKLNEFEILTKWLVDASEVKTGRSMEVTNFTINVDFEYSPPDIYGLVKYQYEWLGFAEIRGKRILMGDAFWRRTLRSGDALIVEYPSGYRVTEISPPPDYDKESERILSWYGARTFEVDELEVIFEERTPTIDFLLIFIGGIAVASISFAGLWFYRFRKKEESETTVTNLLSPLEMKSAEDKVTALLKAAGGSSYQSTITKQCGFSKAKTSMLLTSMENRGIVKRKKQGREKVVTLLEEL